MTKVFIDGSSGTTGLRIRERLSERHDIDIISVPEELHRDISTRLDAIERADIALLCLPDPAACEISDAADAAGCKTVIIDTSSAHRTSDGWVYGFPELSADTRERIRTSRRISNPGCHASGFIAAVYPLVDAGLIPSDMPIAAYSLTGYSGGGKGMIAEYTSDARDPLHESCRIYATGLCHKHLPEMQKVCRLASPPVFSPIVGDYLAGMATCVLLPGQSAEEVTNCLSEHYAGSSLISVDTDPCGGGIIYSSVMAGRDSMKITVGGTDCRTAVIVQFDNLGKGASGAAIQNMNIVIGAPEYEGLVI